MPATLLKPEIAPVTASAAFRTRRRPRPWAQRSLPARLRTLKAARHELARVADQLVDAISSTLPRTRADSYAAEILPLLAACRFLEREAVAILAPRYLGRKGLPFWLAGIDSKVERVPFGSVLIIGPGNYPLFLPGVQTLQALAAGNSVVWKPGHQGRPVVEVFAAALIRAGLPPEALRVTDDSTTTAIAEINAHPDKIVFTGSLEAGRSVLRLAADQAIPVLAELSGADAAIVLPTADLNLVADALAFGMRLNGSATCMAPRRLFLVADAPPSTLRYRDSTAPIPTPTPEPHPLIALLQERFAAMDAVPIDPRTREQIAYYTTDARLSGATILGEPDADAIKPILILNGRADMLIAKADVFAPVLTVLEVPTLEHLLEQDCLCPFGLTAAVFGREPEARALAAQLSVGTVLINDLIVPTADPRVPFGGRRASGFGSTRGREGLLEMTAPKVISARTDRSSRHFQPTGPTHEQLFRGAVAMSHGGTLRERFAGLRQLIRAAVILGKPANKNQEKS